MTPPEETLTNPYLGRYTYDNYQCSATHPNAVEHLQQADHANNMFVRYQLALAEEGNGNTVKAKKLFAEVANYNFNSVGFALTREDAAARAN